MPSTMKFCVGLCLLALLTSETLCQQGNNDNNNNNNQHSNSQQGQGGNQGGQGQQGNNKPAIWPFLGQDQQHQFNPSGGLQAMVTPVLHAGAQISHTALDLGMGFLRWPLTALRDVQQGITGFFNSFANPIWVAPAKHPYDQSLGELIAQLPQSSSTQKPITNKPNNQNNQNNNNNNNQNNQNRPNNNNNNNG